MRYEGRWIGWRPTSCAAAGVIAALLGACGAPPAPPVTAAASDRLHMSTPVAALSAASHGALARQIEAARPSGQPDDLQRWAVNAMLFTLLDDDQPPRWTDPEVWAGCAPGTEVLVNGEPIVVGRRIPEGAFELSWRAIDCHPLGLDGPAMDGRATLQLAPRGPEGWTATVSTDRLEWIGPGWSRRLPAQFVAHAPPLSGTQPRQP